MGEQEYRRNGRMNNEEGKGVRKRERDKESRFTAVSFVEKDGGKEGRNGKRWVLLQVSESMHL